MDEHLQFEELGGGAVEVGPIRYVERELERARVCCQAGIG